MIMMIRMLLGGVSPRGWLRAGAALALIAALGWLAVALIGLGVVLYARWDDAGRPMPWKGDAQ